MEGFLKKRSLSPPPNNKETTNENRNIGSLKLKRTVTIKWQARFEIASLSLR